MYQLKAQDMNDGFLSQYSRDVLYVDFSQKKVLFPWQHMYDVLISSIVAWQHAALNVVCSYKLPFSDFYNSWSIVLE